MKEFKPEEVLKTEVDSDTLKSLPNSFIHDKVVLGIDIYKYSQYPPIEQIYIPVVFESLYSRTVTNVRKNETYLFKSYGKSITDYKKKFISTGDGGFQIFDDVLQAIVFALYFQAFLKRYCSGGAHVTIDKNLYKIVDSIELRFAISRDKIYSYKSNYYGPAIINNARILSKDALNRLLIDLNSIKWLNHNINAAESMLDIDKEALSNTNYFKEYDTSEDSYFFNKSGRILSVDLQKVGALKAKETPLDIFNMHIQARVPMKSNLQTYNVYVVTLGNLNTSGIKD